MRKELVVKLLGETWDGFLGTCAKGDRCYKRIYYACTFVTVQKYNKLTIDYDGNYLIVETDDDYNFNELYIDFDDITAIEHCCAKNRGDYQ